MKKHSVKGVSAAIASLALVGTCFAAPALADTSASSVFASSTSATADTAESAAAAPVADEAGTAAAEQADEVDYAGIIMDALGIDDATLDQVLSGDLSMVEEAMGSDIDADTQAAIDEAESSLAESNLTSESLKEAVNLVLNEANSYLGDLVSQVATYLEDNGYILHDTVLFPGESLLASDSTAQQIDYQGASLLVPGDYSIDEMTGEDLADALDAENAENLPDSVILASAPSGETGVFVTEFAPRDGFTASELFNDLAENPKLLNYDDGDIMVTAGTASLDDGTPILELGYINYSTDDDAQHCMYELVVMPSANDGFLVVFALADENAPAEDFSPLGDVLTSLTGTGALQGAAL